MRRLNQSASWYSDVDNSSDEEAAKQAKYQQALKNTDFLAKALSTSATFIHGDGRMVYDDQDVSYTQDVPVFQPEQLEPPHGVPIFWPGKLEAEVAWAGMVDSPDCGGRHVVRSSSC